ncbi:MAG: trigger factor [Actinomycetia bacterium]|nr:trigger factor [Actinomycetes bacterium]
MPSTVEKLSPTRAKLVIELPFEDLQPAIDAAYGEIARQVNIPGFRRGHVPPRLIDQRYGRGAVLQEAINDVLPTAYTAALSENGLTPLGRPDIDVTKLEDGQTVEFTAEVDVRPEFTLPDVSKVTVTVPVARVGDDEVDERVQRLRQRFATYTDLDRPAEAGDVVVLDLEARQNGELLADSTAEGMAYRLGEGGLVEGLDEAATGLRAGESATFAAVLIGGPHKDESADVTVTVQKVQAQELPAVDDEFAQMVSEYDTSEEMLAGLRESLERMARLDQANKARDAALDAVIAQTEFELPEKLVDDEVTARKQQVTDQLAQAGLTVDDYLAANPQEGIADADGFLAEIATQAKHALRAQIILDKLAEDLQVRVTQEDLSQLIMQKAMANNTTPEEEAQHMMDHDHTLEWMGEVRRGKALGALVSRVKVTDTDGAVVDVSRLRGDGTLADPTPDAQAPVTTTIEWNATESKAKDKDEAADPVE